MRLLDIIQGKLLIPQMRSANKWDAIEELVDQLVQEHEIRILDRRTVLDAVLARERSQSTGLNRNVALPHGRSRAVEDLIGVLGVAPQGIPFESTDGLDARLICLLVIPEVQYREHIKTVADVAHLLSDQRLQQELIAAGLTGFADRVRDVIERAEGPRFFGTG